MFSDQMHSEVTQNVMCSPRFLAKMKNFHYLRFANFCEFLISQSLNGEVSK